MIDAASIGIIAASSGHGVGNPYGFSLYGVSALLAAVAACFATRSVRLCILAVATVWHWIVLHFFVDWAYTHPLNSADGAARTMVSMFGWAHGLLWVILPAYFISRGVLWAFRAIKGSKAVSSCC